MEEKLWDYGQSRLTPLGVGVGVEVEGLNKEEKELKDTDNSVGMRGCGCRGKRVWGDNW